MYCGGRSNLYFNHAVPESKLTFVEVYLRFDARLFTLHPTPGLKILPHSGPLILPWSWLDPEFVGLMTKPKM